MNIESQNKQYNNDFQGGTLKGALSHAALGGDNLAQNPYMAQNTGSASFKDILNSEMPLLDNEIDDILESLEFIQSINFDTVNIDKANAMFFINVVNQAGYTNYTIQNDGSVIDASNYKSIEVSKTLSDVLSKIQNTKQAVRLDFDNNVTVVLRMSEDGKINAHFIPGDKAVEEYLKNNIPYLKQRFEEQNIPYANLSYKGQQQRQNNNGQNNKEKNNE